MTPRNTGRGSRASRPSPQWQSTKARAGRFGRRPSLHERWAWWLAARRRARR